MQGDTCSQSPKQVYFFLTQLHQMCSITYRWEVHRQEALQDTYLPLIEPSGKRIALLVWLDKPLQSVPFSGTPQMNLVKVHHPGPYLMKACFRFGLKTMVVILFSTDDFSTSPSISNEQEVLGAEWDISVLTLKPWFPIGFTANPFAPKASTRNLYPTEAW